MQRGTATYASAAQLAQASRGPDPEGYRDELARGMAPANQTAGLRLQPHPRPFPYGGGEPDMRC